MIVARARRGRRPLIDGVALRRGAGRRARRRRAARRRHRARGRRHDLLHVGHDGPAEGRARHPPQHLHEPHEPRLRPGPSRGSARTTPTQQANAGTRTSDQNAYLLTVPFFHATGCHSVLVANLFFGGKIVMMHKWDAERALELIERERITTFGGVPAMVWQVLDHPRLRQAGHLQRPLDRLRRRAGPARARAPDRGDLPGPHAEQRLRADRDVVGHDDEHRRRLPAQARQRRRARARVRREGGRPGRHRRCRSARSASSGSTARTS